MAGKDTPSAVVAVRPKLAVPSHIHNPAPLPPEIDGQFTVQDWFTALVTKEKYIEPNPDYMAERMLLLTLFSTTPEQVLTPKDLKGLQDLIPNVPWATTGPIILTDVYVAASDQEDGNTCYMLISYDSLDTGMSTTTTTGATHLQAQVLTLVALGAWPIKCQITRGDRQDKGGRYMFAMTPVE